MAELAYSRSGLRSGNLDWTAAPTRLSVSWIVRMLLTAAFAVSFLQYWTPVAATQYVHLVLLFASGLLVLADRGRRQRLENLLNGGLLVVIAVLFTEVVSYYSGDTYSVLYGATLLAVVLSARLVLLQIGLSSVMRAFYRAGLLVTAFLVLEGRKGLSQYSAGNRFVANGGAHPNLIAFILAGYLPVMTWRALEYPPSRKRLIVIALCVLNVILVFLSGSRGSLLAICLAAVALMLRVGFTGRFWSKVRFRHLHVILFLVTITFAFFFFARNHRLERLGDFLNTSLSLNSSQRGLKSGFSGRTAFWSRAIHWMREENRWLFGFGYRMGDVMVGTVDNGYLQLVFETGLVSGGIIFGAMLAAFFRLWRMTRIRENSVWRRYYFMLWCMLLVYFVNNMSTRYLLSFGNGFSVCVIFLMIASPAELAGRRTARVLAAPAAPGDVWAGPRRQAIGAG